MRRGSALEDFLVLNIFPDLVDFLDEAHPDHLIAHHVNRSDIFCQLRIEVGTVGFNLDGLHLAFGMGLFLRAIVGVLFLVFLFTLLCCRRISL